MPYAIELCLDERADHQIRQIWAAPDERGIPAFDVVARFPIPIVATAAGAHLVEVFGGHTSIDLTRPQ